MSFYHTAIANHCCLCKHTAIYSCYGLFIWTLKSPYSYEYSSTLLLMSKTGYFDTCTSSFLPCFQNDARKAPDIGSGTAVALVGSHGSVVNVNNVNINNSREDGGMCIWSPQCGQN